MTTTAKPSEKPNPSDELRRIAGLARMGRLDEAAQAVVAAVAAEPEDPALAALGGAVEFHRGDFARAATYLERAHSLRPQDLVVRTNLAESYLRTDRKDEALALCDEACAFAEPSLRLARLGAHLAQEAGDFAKAARLYRHVLARQPDDWSLLNNLGNTLSEQGEAAEAIEVLQRAMALAPDSPPIRVNLGTALLLAERVEEGETVLRDAARDFPDDHVPMLTLARFYHDNGIEDRQYEAIAEAARRAPGDAALQSDYGQEAARRNDYAIAEGQFEAALVIEPALGPSFVGLAAVYERSNREAELEPLRERALASGTDAQSLAYIDALRFKRAEDFGQAFEALEQSGEVVVANRRHQLRGIMLDRMERYDEAFGEFAAMNASHLDEPSQPAVRAERFRGDLARDRALVTPQWLGGWSETPPADRASPVILLGFPRSGTTLLDTMLMTAPNTLVLEEEPFFGEIETQLGGVNALAGLDAAAIVAARARYFERVSQHAPLGPDRLAPDTLIIDKHPLHLGKVPVIRRLFPDARFVLALRHPCDVILSCFITNFRPNNAMSNFLDLETAARFYDLTFSYWEQAREVFDLPVRTVVYERLVADQARELAPLFDWLDLPWAGEAFDHREAARARGVVRTASYAQVTEAIYTRAAGRWRRYEKHLEPVLDILRPWVERFGYSLEDDRVPAWGGPPDLDIDPV
ncbi:tetratricopeptide repeat protein [Novosphingobium sp. PhB57]|uniref:tetratricopeptide repeat-containing sulfotransferase family protein n=1 Tax=Novosphingobium sp. PhB57 TaxID=2485107 RepID=UPI00104D43D5|nr:tetratricopeptide repeat-containing sulfotransferase family protein [Novosphingobium sp. PhB57]TCU61840.1 tetratricopeptide repeat protein [Novosphingobium sp. PhB57]